MRWFIRGFFLDNSSISFHTTAETVEEALDNFEDSLILSVQGIEIDLFPGDSRDVFCGGKKTCYDSNGFLD